MMRIVIVCRCYTTHRRGGMLFVVQDRAEELAARGYDVHVLTTGHDDHKPEPVTVNGVHVHHLDCRPMIYTDEFARVTEAAYKKLAPDILHMDGHDPNRAWWVNRLASTKAAGLTHHGLETGGFLTNWNLYRCGINKTVPVFPADIRDIAKHMSTLNFVAACNLFETWMLTDIYGLKNAITIGNPIAPYFFTPAKPADISAPLLCVAVAGANNRGFQYAKLAAEMAGTRLVVTENVARKDMPAQYDACSALILPTFYSQGFDLTVTEAFARRRPVFVTPTGSYYWALQQWPHYMTAIPMADPEGIAKALQGPAKHVPNGAAHHATPAVHADRWLEAFKL